MRWRDLLRWSTIQIVGEGRRAAGRHPSQHSSRLGDDSVGVAGAGVGRCRSGPRCLEWAVAALCVLDGLGAMPRGRGLPPSSPPSLCFSWPRTAPRRPHPGTAAGIRMGVWTTLFKGVWRSPEHINVQELRTVVALLRHCARAQSLWDIFSSIVPGSRAGRARLRSNRGTSQWSAWVLGSSTSTWSRIVHTSTAH